MKVSFQRKVMLYMNQIEKDNMDFFLNDYKDIVKNKDGTFSLRNACILKDGKLHFLKGINNQFGRNCYDCKHCQPGQKFNYCLLRTHLENLPSNKQIPVHYIADCEAYDSYDCIMIVKSKDEMIDLVESFERYFYCVEDYERYFGFSLDWDEETGKVLETVKEYYEHGGEFTNIPYKYPCVIYFSQLDPEVYVNQNISLKWVYIGSDR